MKLISVSLGAIAFLFANITSSSAFILDVRHRLAFRGGSSGEPSAINNNTTVISYSACSVRGDRQYMEDEYFVSEDGKFAAVFDGHGGAAVSRYLRQNLFANIQASLPSTPSLADKASALELAFNKVDCEVQDVIHWSFQGRLFDTLYLL
eukprot:g3061.t1.1.5e1746aa g3061  g3061.t1 contig12:1336206-1336869(-)